MPFPTLDELFGRSRRSRFLSVLDIPHLLLCILILGLNIGLYTSGRLERVENNFLDFFLRQSPSQAADPSIVLIEIDKESLRSIGKWPWPWKYHAQMLEILKKWKVDTIVFDFPFLEENSNQDAPAEIVKTMEAAPPVYLPVQLTAKTGKKIWVHGMPIEIEPENEGKVWVHSVSEIEKAAKGLGHLNLTPDPDGVVRRIQPFLAYQGQSYFYLPLQVGYDFLKKKLQHALDLELPVDRRGKVLVNWTAKKPNAFQEISYSDLVQSGLNLERGMKPLVDPLRLKDKICFIGVTAPDSTENVVSPIESSVSSFKIHAQVLDNTLRQNFIKPVSVFVNTFILCILGFIASILFVIFGNVISFVAALLLAGAWLVFGFLILMERGLWFSVFHPVFLILSLFICSAIFNQFRAKKETLRLFDLATRDGLTGLYVIRHFREILNQAVLESVERKRPLCVILMDIDNFKAINDTYGHSAGDGVLKKTAHLISQSLRHMKRPLHQMDFAARYGGEEFIVMIRNTSLKETAFKIAERMRKNVENAFFEWEGKPIPVTLSLGVASLHAGEKIPDLMVRRADEALYRAKKNGKNQVCLETFAGV